MPLADGARAQTWSEIRTAIVKKKRLHQKLDTNYQGKKSKREQFVIHAFLEPVKSPEDPKVISPTDRFLRPLADDTVVQANSFLLLKRLPEHYGTLGSIRFSLPLPVVSD